MNGETLTTGPEVTAYLVAHVIGIVSTYVLSPMMFRAIAAGSLRWMLPAAGLGMSLVTMVVVLFLFLHMRRAFSSSQ
jgi:heme/copper-type cytochrome/quinol oxidase subunit 4